MMTCCECTKERKKFKALSAKRERRILRQQIKGYEPKYRERTYPSSYQSYRDERERDKDFHTKIFTGRSLPDGYSLRHVFNKSLKPSPADHSPDGKTQENPERRASV